MIEIYNNSIKVIICSISISIFIKELFALFCLIKMLVIIIKKVVSILNSLNIVSIHVEFRNDTRLNMRFIILSIAFHVILSISISILSLYERIKNISE
jgi:hypothetical protein